jgi:hypothetical protein
MVVHGVSPSDAANGLKMLECSAQEIPTKFSRMRGFVFKCGIIEALPSCGTLGPVRWAGRRPLQREELDSTRSMGERMRDLQCE